MTAKYESDETEFKECSGKKRAKLPHDLWQSIAAFSNSHGGTIYLGVANDGRTVDLSATDLDALQKDVSVLVNGAFNIKPDIEIRVANKLVLLEVKEAEFYNKPIYSKKAGPKKIYIRQGSTNVLANDDEMKSLFAGAFGGGENQTIQGPISEIVDEGKLDSYISHTGLKKITFASIEQKLSKLKARRDNKLTIFGLVAFSKPGKIEEYTNNLYIDFRVFKGTNKVNLADRSVIYSDRKEFHGDIRTQFRQAFKYVKSKLPTEAAFNSKTGLREDRYIIPEDALREVLANAVAHRDYLIQSSCVNIDLYEDRIEITNPGESLVAIRDLEKVSSKARNPNLMEYLKAYHITDKTARGIPIVYQATRSRGLLKPKFENIAGCFRATLYFSSPHNDRDKEWVALLTSRYSLKDTQVNALVYIKNNQSISNKQYCEINHMNQRNDDRRARRELVELVNCKLVKVQGKGPGTKYVLA